MPPASDASPMSATTFSSVPFNCRALARPVAMDSESEAWPEKCTSKGLSVGLVNPDMPP